MELWTKMVLSLGLLFLNSGSYTSAHILLNLLNEMSKSHKMRALSIIFFRNEFDNFNNAGARMLDSFFHRTLKLLRNHILSQKT